MKKLFALFLVVVMLATALVACNDTTDTSEPASADAASTVVSTLPDESSKPAESSQTPAEEVCWLPEKDWNKTLIWASACPDDNKEDVRYYEIWCEEELGDTISKSVLNRSRWLQDTYGISIEMQWFQNSYEVADYVQKAGSSSLPLDVVTGAIYSLAPKVKEGLYLDFASINKRFNDGKGWLRLEESYWDQNSMRDYSIANRIYMLTGDLLLYDDESTWAMFFNKGLVAQHGIEDPYKTVRDGNWTIDYIHQLAREYTTPEGDKLTWDADANHTWTLITQSFDTLMFMLGCGQNLITKDADDLPVMRISDQRHVDVTQKVMGMLIDENAVAVGDFYYSSWTAESTKVEVGIFANGHAMFMPQQMAFLNDTRIKECEFEIGVIPMPKADDLQENYSSSSNVYNLQMVAIPYMNDENLEATLFALEAMAWYGQRYVKPEYYEKVLKLQKFRDENAEEMLDMIFNNRTYDLGVAFSWGDMIQFYNQLTGSRSTDVMSKYEQFRDKYQAAIDEAVAAILAQKND